MDRMPMDMLAGLAAWVALSWPLAAPTVTPLLPIDEGPVGISGSLFYVLLLLGTVLFLGAFFYSRRKGH
jgi:hypothetical protein